jgi:hypothetical protein
MIWEGVLKEKLEALGITVRVATFTGDSSYPVEYSLTIGNVRTGGEPTLDLAMVALIGKLLEKANEQADYESIRSDALDHRTSDSGE